MNAKTPLVALSVAAILLSAQTPQQEAIPAFEAVAMVPVPGYPAFEHKLHMTGHVNELRVIGGNTGEFCAFVAGIDTTVVPLPGDAALRVEPLAFYIVGEFDANGEFVLPLNYSGKPIEPASVLVQALTYFGTTYTFGSSNYGAVNFDGIKNFEFHDMGP